MAEQEPISGSSRDYGSIASPPTVGFSDFSPTELYNLSQTIADNVTIINNGLRSLEKMMKDIGGPNDNIKMRDKIHDTQQSVNSYVSANVRDIQRLNVIARRGDKPQKLQVERLSRAFSDALMKYTTVQKEVTEKMLAHMPKQVRVPSQDDSWTLEKQAIADDQESSLLANEQAQAQLIQFETSMLLEKEAQINRIEADVLDVKGIIAHLATLANAQAETIDTVETHIEAAAASVEDGVSELQKAEQHQRSYRKKMFFFSLIGIILALIIITWIVKSFTKS